MTAIETHAQANRSFVVSLRLFFASMLFACLLIAWSAAPLRAGEPTSDQNSLARIFGDDHLANVLALHEQATQAPPEQRYMLCRDAVFPPGRTAIRFDFDFSPAHVCDPIAEAYGFSDPWSRWRGPHDANRFSRGGELLSPVVSLMTVAEQLGKLDEIAALMENRSAYAGNEKAILAFQLLLAIARKDMETAQQEFQSFDHLVASRSIGDSDLGPETIVLSRAALVPELQHQAFELAFRLYQHVSSGNALHSESWRRHLFATTYLLQWQRSQAGQKSSGDDDDAVYHRWHPVTRMSADTNGQGFPIPMWNVRRGRISSVTGHDHDYLYYDTPLTGDFTVEADVSPFGYGDTRLGFGGVWAGPEYDLQSILSGRFAADDETITVNPPLDEIDGSMRVRLTVKDGVRTTFINGRRIFQANVSTSDPWLSIFSIWFTHGWVKNLRITGDVIVPDVIDLATRADLVGWNPYFGESLGGVAGDWRYVNASHLEQGDSNEAYLLQAVCQYEKTKSFRESLLQYHRPMMEDGSISYEFFYRQGQILVHPALGRCAFLIDPSGVGVHWIGDGRFERTSLRSDNAYFDSQQQHPSRLQLRNDAWNRIELQVVGDRAKIHLNGQLVFETAIAPSNSRTFGFFRYADQSEARIRNISWRGDWPKAVPQGWQQELADDAVEQLLGSPELPESFDHDFSSGAGRDKFLAWGEGIQPLANGLKVLRTSGGQHSQTVITPQLQLGGDFDVIAEFNGFDGEIENGGDANILLSIGFSEKSTECIVYRKFTRFEKPEGRQVIQAAHFYARDGERAYEFPFLTSEASQSGKLRLSRRGDQLHYLYAAEDSSNYRFLHTETVPSGETSVGGLRLVAEVTRSGKSEVEWKSLKVRADKISGLAKLPSHTIAELDQSRTMLPVTSEVDFSGPNAMAAVRTIGKDSKFQFGKEGLTVVAPGFNDWQGHFVILNTLLVGDFDVALDLEIKKLENPNPGGESVVLIQAEVNDPLKTYVETKFAISDDGETAGEIQIRRVNEEGQYEYKELARVPLQEVSQLRLARRQGIAYFIVQSDPAAPPTLLGRLELGRLPINPGYLRLIVHTSGEGHETIILFKKLKLQSERIPNDFR